MRGQGLGGVREAVCSWTAPWASKPERGRSPSHPFNSFPSLRLRSKSCWGTSLPPTQRGVPELTSDTVSYRWASWDGLKARRAAIGIVKEVYKDLSPLDHLIELEGVLFLMHVKVSFLSLLFFFC